MLPFVERCGEISVLIMNPCSSHDPSKEFQLTDSMTEHAFFVWDNYVKSSGFEEICIVANREGGHLLNKIMLRDQDDDFFHLVASIAYTDSTVVKPQSLSVFQSDWMFQNATHYFKSKKPARTIIEQKEMAACSVKSAGHRYAAYTTGFAAE